MGTRGLHVVVAARHDAGRGAGRGAVGLGVRGRRSVAALEILAGRGLPHAVLTAEDEPEQRLGDGLFEA